MGASGTGKWDLNRGETGALLGLITRSRPFDYVIIQIAKTGEIHALAIVKDKYYDDQTPIWRMEIKQRRVLFPWRVPFCFIIFSEEPILRRFIEIQNYIDGYGLGEITDGDIRDVIKAIEEKSSLNLKIFWHTAVFIP
ncbi:MAG: hypothetical protein ACTSU6_07515 [Candidatus Njordarchaeales archaeon]